jgi:hypothetical protein
MTGIPTDPAGMTDRNDDFRIRPRRPHRRSPGAIRMLPFVAQVQIAVRKAGGSLSRIGGSAGKGTGRFNARGRGAKVVAGFRKEGGGWQRDSAGRFRMRRVVVKARVVKLARPGAKMRGATIKAVDAHLRYLERDGVTRDGKNGHAYSAFEAEADSRAFIERGREDRHQFRVIVAPEDAAEIADLRGLTYAPSQQGEYVSGRLAGVATLVSGRFAMIDDGLGFQLVPWQPVLDSRLGQHITGIARDTGIDWTFGRNRGLGR